MAIQEHLTLLLTFGVEECNEDWGRAKREHFVPKYGIMVGRDGNKMLH